MEIKKIWGHIDTLPRNNTRLMSKRTECVFQLKSTCSIQSCLYVECDGTHDSLSSHSIIVTRNKIFSISRFMARGSDREQFQVFSCPRESEFMNYSQRIKTRKIKSNINKRVDSESEK